MTSLEALVSLCILLGGKSTRSLFSSSCADSNTDDEHAAAL